MRRFFKTLAITLVILALGVTLVVVVLERFDAPSTSVSQACSASADSVSWSLTPEQAENAALIGTRPISRAMPARAATIGLATAYQESKIRNINYGDRDSLGLFQQRPSQGWGTEDQVSDPVYATDAFYDVLARIDGYATLPVTVAAQKVQRSAFPDAYADHEAMGRAWASALNGYSGTNIVCTLRPLDEAVTAADNVRLLTDRLARDFPGITPESGAAPEAGTGTETATGTNSGPETEPGSDADSGSEAGSGTGSGSTIQVDARTLVAEYDLSSSDTERMALALANWAVAVASPMGVTNVVVGTSEWDRESGEWSASGEAAATPYVTITVGGTA